GERRGRGGGAGVVARGGEEEAAVAGEAAQDRVHARVVGVALVGEDVEDPRVAVLEPARRAIAADAARAGALERLARAREVVAELLAAHGPDRNGQESAARDLVAARTDAPHELGLLLRRRTVHEERRGRGVRRKQRQRVVDVLLEARLEAVPVLALQRARERPVVEELLHGDSEHVAARRGSIQNAPRPDRTAGTVLAIRAR